MRLTGRGVILLSFLLLDTALPAEVPPPPAIVVVYESGVEAYGEAFEGVRLTLGNEGFRPVDLRAGAGREALAQALASPDTRLFLAVGTRAAAEVHSRAPRLPVVTTMVLRDDEYTPSGGRVHLDIPLAVQFGSMRSLWPRHLRVGIIRNPVRSRLSVQALEARARKEGYEPLVVDCDGPARLVKTVSALKGKVDFLLCFPDGELYNPVTIKPFVLASLESRLPVLGFSRAFVRAGAAAGVYPDYVDIGRQAAEMALRILGGEEPGSDEPPRSVKVAVNQRVARLLGVEFKTAARPVEVFR